MADCSSSCSSFLWLACLVCPSYCSDLGIPMLKMMMLGPDLTSPTPYAES